jgi:hypothetical protein
MDERQEALLAERNGREIKSGPPKPIGENRSIAVEKGCP